MAWQLFYTSSPRLLEAGRTGFGTVAKHREVGTLLTGQLESISQFTRLAGYDSDRVIYTHRILESGSSRYHVLSCVQNAGSDYSGRTNHIAHHLIISREEAAVLSRCGVTPADIVWGMEWKGSWTDIARFLTAEEEVNLAGMTAQPFQLWQKLTGRADSARLPWSPQCERGCCLVVPSGQDARLILGESMRQQPARAWEITFTTHVEPNDSLGDFRWICLSPNSPGFAQIQASARVIFDLGAPQSLPEPPPPFQVVSSGGAAANAVGAPNQSAGAVRHASAPTTLAADDASTWGTAMLAEAERRAVLSQAQPARISPEPNVKKTRRAGPILAAFGLGLLMLGGGAYYHFENLRQQEVATWTRQQMERLTSLWRQYALREQDETWKFLQGQIQSRAADHAMAEHQLSQAEEFWKEVAACLAGPGQLVGFNADDNALMQHLSLLKDAVNAWLSARQIALLKLGPQGWVGWAEAQQSLIQESAAWAQIVALVQAQSPPWNEARAKFDQEIRLAFSETLQQAPASMQTYHADARTVLSQLATAQPGWLDTWQRLATMQPGEKLGTSEHEALAKADLPAWLRQQVEARKPPSTLATPTAPMPKLNGATAAREVALPGSSASPAPQAPADPSAASALLAPVSAGEAWPIFIATVPNLQELHISHTPKLPLEENMELQVHPLTLSRAGEYAVYGKYRNWAGGTCSVAQSLMSPKEKVFSFEQYQLMRVPAELAAGDGIHLRALSGGKVKFELYVQSRKSKLTELLAGIGSVKAMAIPAREPGAYQIHTQGLLPRLKGPGEFTLQLMLEAKPEVKYTLRISPPEAELKLETEKMSDIDQIRARLKKIENELTEAAKSITSAEKQKQELMFSKRADKDEKVASQDRILNDRAELMQKLNDEKADLENRLKNPPKPPALVAGKYVLLGVEKGRGDTPVRLCLIDLEISQPR